MKTPLLICGAGAWGTAIAMVAHQAGNPVRLWGHDPKHMQTLAQTRQNSFLPGVNLPEGIEYASTLVDALEGVHELLLVVPSQAIPEVVKRLNEEASMQHITHIGIASKGVEKGSGRFLHEVVQIILGENASVGILSGPSFAREVAEGLPTALTYACRDQEAKQSMIQRLATPHFRLYASDDLIGVALGGLLKNILAIAAGLSDGLKLGANARSALITRGLAEMFRLGQALGAKQSTLVGLAGVGDVILTATDDQSRNRQFGLQLGAGKSVSEALDAVGSLVEGWYNVEQAYQLARQHEVSLPITEQIYAILYQNQSIQNALEALLSRNLKEEV